MIDSRKLLLGTVIKLVLVIWSMPIQAQQYLSSSYYCQITNKAENEEYKLNYVNNNLQLITTPGEWRFVPVNEADESSNSYRILVNINGEYHAIYATSTEVYANIAKFNTDDKRQIWQLDLMYDGYYRFTNEELSKVNNPQAFLFCSSDRRLYLSKWIELQTLNGRWKVERSSKPIPPEIQPLVDNKSPTNLNQNTPPTPPVPVQTRITTTSYYNISNKSQDEQYKLNFSIPDNALLLQNIPGYWKLEPVTGGSYQWDGTSYRWNQEAASNLFRILFFTNGKYWALSATKDGYPKITEFSLMDMYQTWAIDFQTDGYYKITNSNLGAANLPNAVLFCASDKKLFMADWDESKSFNGRWKLQEAGAIPVNQVPDKFDNKRFTLTSAKTNQIMCTEYIYTSDATQALFITPCRNNNSAKFIFQKTTGGDYFMIVEGLRDGQAYTNYLDHRLSALDKENFDLTNPNLQYTWKIIEMDYGRYKVKNSLTNEALEFIPGDQWIPGRSTPFSIRPDRIQLKIPEAKIEQLWHIRD